MRKVVLCDKHRLLSICFHLVPDTLQIFPFGQLMSCRNNPARLADRSVLVAT
jgi:hypothetical protein